MFWKKFSWNSILKKKKVFNRKKNKNIQSHKVLSLRSSLRLRRKKKINKSRSKLNIKNSNKNPMKPHLDFIHSDHQCY